MRHVACKGEKKNANKIIMDFPKREETGGKNGIILKCPNSGIKLSLVHTATNKDL
jgi:hypothetical protein